MTATAADDAGTKPTAVPQTNTAARSSGSRSLAGRLILILTLSQSLVAIAGMSAWMLFSPFVSFDDVASATTRDLVLEALEQRDGRLAIARSTALDDYRKRRPELRFAAFGADGIAAGSDPLLSAVLERLGPVLPRNGQIDATSPGGAGLARFASTTSRFGEIVVVSTGDAFGIDDINSFLTVYLVELVPLFGPALLVGIVIVPLVVWRTMRPVVAAARLASTIDVASLDARLDADSLPCEIASFGAAINNLLARLSQDIDRQTRFAANAAHELRTPIAILEAKIDAMEAGETRNELKRSVNRLGLLLNQLLAAARMGRATPALEERVDIVDLARDVVSDCAPLALRRGRRIELQVGASSLTVRGDRQALASAISNIVDNALAFEPIGGEVLVSVDQDGRGRVVVDIADHGVGISQADRPYVFDPFWRRDHGRVGSGLGLAISAEIAQRHGGTVDIIDRAGWSTVLRVALPAA